MEHTDDSLLNTRRADLPQRIAHLVNKQLEADETSYEFTTQTYLIRAVVGDGLVYFRYTTLKLTPAQVTELFETDLACINAKVESIALEWEDDF